MQVLIDLSGVSANLSHSPACLFEATMADSEAPPLLVYDTLWQQSLADRPATWPDQFRALCRAARAWRKAPTLHPLLLGEGERLMLQSLGTCNVEMMVMHIAAMFPDDPNPMHRLDPTATGASSAAAAAKAGKAP
jgi:hypothetical protein